MRFCWDFPKNSMSFVMRFLYSFLYVEMWTFTLKMRVDVAFMDDPYRVHADFSCDVIFMVFLAFHSYDMPRLFLCEIIMFIL